MFVVPVPMDISIIKTDYDIAIMRIHSHTAFPNGYPTLEVEDYSQIFEGMEITTCGFPLGNDLWKRRRTMTSSFTKGILGSVIPVPGCNVSLLKGFQVDIAATHGNSGGPVCSIETGKVFGILQSGLNEKGQILTGLTKAEPIYPLLGDVLAEILTLPSNLFEGSENDK